MIHSLETKNIGPISHMTLEFGDRLNIITGDNGLGKSFLLDVIWWVLTRTWPATTNPALLSGFMARPSANVGATQIGYHFGGETEPIKRVVPFVWHEQKWKLGQARPGIPGLVIYAQADGSFAVWDPARNYWFKRGEFEDADRPPAFIFSKKEVFEGLEYKGKRSCNGLIYDVSFWQSAKDTANAELFAKTLRSLSPAEDEPLTLGELTSIDTLTATMMPTVSMSYGQNVPILHTSSGIKRALSLAYLLTWAWVEHKRASQVLGKPTTKSIILLIDEVECHLHPKWQRTMLPSLLQTVIGLGEQNDTVQVQVIATTHAPLVLASLETVFDRTKDRWFDFDVDKKHVTLTSRDFIVQGAVGNWLTSKAFDLRVDCSKERENVYVKLQHFMQGNPTKKAALELERELGAVLSDIDPLWVRWRTFGRSRGWWE